MEGKLDCSGIPGGAQKLGWPWEAAVALGEAALSSPVGIFPWGKLLRGRLMGKTRVSTAAAGLETHVVVNYLPLLLSMMGSPPRQLALSLV